MQKFRIAENRMFHADGHDFLFLTGSSAIFETDPDIKDILEQGFRAGELSREEFFSRMSGSDEENREFFEEIVNRGVLVKANSEAFARTTGTEQGAIPLKTLVLHVTEACNLGCRYCYHSQNGHAPGKTGRTMSSEVAQQAIDFLFEHSGSLEEVILVFFGGEPLMNFNLIVFAVKYARDKALEKGKKVSFAITTNGTLLTDKAIRFLHENKIGITVSIDGFEEAHDRFRRFPDGTPSYQVILPRIKNLLRLEREKPVVARVTVAGDSGDVPEILDHLLDLGFSEAGFAPVTTPDTSYQLNADGMNKLLDQFGNLSDKFLEIARQGDFFGFTNLIDLLVVLHEGEVKNYPCGAGLGLFAADPEGRLYICQRLTGESSCYMGDIFKGFDQGKIGTFREQAEIGQRNLCRTCWVRTICAGGCYHEAMVREGGLTKSNLHYCDWIKTWVDMGLAVYARLTLECPEYLEKLSMLRGHAPLFSQVI
ncbi:radical SAM protein [Desulfococcaceae bacterium HSG8]|nr:radical SAM protein [Desulfococcaceae bacterium HSG8]